MRYVFIVNPNAGGKKGFESIKRKVEDYFKNTEISYMVYETTHQKHATEIVENELKSGDSIRFYGVGGDGTLLEIIRGAANNPNAEVGIFPVGSGNDYIRTYGDRNLFLNFDNQMRGKSIDVDLIKTLGGYAINICSVGLDAKVAYEMANFKTLPGVNGSLAYDLSLAKALMGKLGEKLTIKIKCNNEVKTYSGTYLFALGASGQWYGGGYHGAPIAITNDGLLDFVLIKKPPIYKIASLVGEYKKGLHLNNPKFADLLTFCRGTEIELISNSELICNRDGECDKVTSEKFTVEPKAVKFILPYGLEYSENAIETDRLILRHWQQSDYDDFYEFASDADVMPAAGAKLCTSIAETKDRLSQAINDENAYAIVLKDNKKVIGSIKYQNDIRRFLVKSKSVGYELNKKYWGNGYMTEALNAIVKNAFENLDLDVLAIGHFVGNEKSKRVIEKCGFKYEGIIRKAYKRYDDKIFDDVAYSITKEEYSKKL